jgi:hypothetical protein
VRARCERAVCGRLCAARLGTGVQATANPSRAGDREGEARLSAARYALRPTGDRDYRRAARPRLEPNTSEPAAVVHVLRDQPDDAARAPRRAAMSADEHAIGRTVSASERAAGEREGDGSGRAGDNAHNHAVRDRLHVHARGTGVCLVSKCEGQGSHGGGHEKDKAAAVLHSHGIGGRCRPRVPRSRETRSVGMRDGEQSQDDHEARQRCARRHRGRLLRVAAERPEWAARPRASKV